MRFQHIQHNIWVLEFVVEYVSDCDTAEKIGESKFGFTFARNPFSTSDISLKRKADGLNRVFCLLIQLGKEFANILRPIQ